MAKLEGKVRSSPVHRRGSAHRSPSTSGPRASVVVNYASSKSGAERVVSAIKGHGGKAIAVQADVARPADIERLFAESQKAFGRLDILVNNAGIYEFRRLKTSRQSTSTSRLT